MLIWDIFNGYERFTISMCLAVYANEEKNCFNVSGNNKKNKTVVDVTEHYLTVNR